MEFSKEEVSLIRDMAMMKFFEINDLLKTVDKKSDLSKNLEKELRESKSIFLKTCNYEKFK